MKDIQFLNSSTISSMKELLDQGVNINATDESGQTQLIRMAKSKNKEEVIFLIEEGADLEHIDYYGNSVEDYIHDDPQLMEMLENEKLTGFIGF